MAYIHQKPPKITQNDFLGPKGHEKVTYDLPGDPILVNFESWSSGIKKQIIEFSSENLKSDKEVVMVAVKQEG